MPKPQIARRCSSCGVSIRVPASFCPQCGNALTPRSDTASDTESLTGAAVLDVTDKSLAETRPLSFEQKGAGTPDVTDRLAETMPLNFEHSVTPPTPVSASVSVPHKQPKQATVGKVQRGGPQPRAVIGEDGLNRVEKFRQMSGAMIDEASYDPSLRFVLVAAVLFVLFLALLLLSELIT